MKKIIIFSLLFMFPVCVFSQVVQIVGIKGDVSVKKAQKSSWQPAELEMKLSRQAEVKTGYDSECILSFDQDQKNTITLKSNSHIKINNIKLGRIFLNKGKVLSLIDDINAFERAEKPFQIKTTTAIVGVTGTGWGTETQGGAGTDANCFDGSINVQGVGADGSITGQEDIFEGFGISVGADGMLGDIFSLDNDAYDDWNDFKGNVEGVRGGAEASAGLDDRSDLGNTGDITDSSLDDDFYSDFRGGENFEDTREDVEDGGEDICESGY